MHMGDPACHMTSICLSCGCFLETPRWEDQRCPHCGQEVDAPDREYREGDEAS